MVIELYMYMIVALPGNGIMVQQTAVCVYLLGVFPVYLRTLYILKIYVYFENVKQNLEEFALGSGKFSSKMTRAYFFRFRFHYIKLLCYSQQHWRILCHTTRYRRQDIFIHL